MHRLVARLLMSPPFAGPLETTSPSQFSRLPTLLQQINRVNTVFFAQQYGIFLFRAFDFYLKDCITRKDFGITSQFEGNGIIPFTDGRNVLRGAGIDRAGILLHTQQSPQTISGPQVEPESVSWCLRRKRFEKIDEPCP